MFRAVQTFFKGGQIRLPTSKYGVTKILLYIYNIIYSEFHFHGITAAWYNLTAVVVTCKIIFILSCYFFRTNYIDYFN